MKNATFIFKSNNTGKLNVATLSSLYRVGKSNISNSPFVSSECLAAMTSIAAHKNAFKSFFMLVRRSQKVKSNQHFFFSLVKSAFKYAVGFVRINDKFKYKKSRTSSKHKLVCHLAKNAFGCPKWFQC